MLADCKNLPTLSASSCQEKFRFDLIKALLEALLTPNSRTSKKVAVALHKTKILHLIAIALLDPTKIIEN